METDTVDTSDLKMCIKCGKKKDRKKDFHPKRGDCKECRSKKDKGRSRKKKSPEQKKKDKLKRLKESVETLIAADPIVFGESKTAMRVVIGDIHIPHHNRRAWKVFLKFLEKNSDRISELIINGDFIDLPSLFYQASGTWDERFDKAFEDISIAVLMLEEIKRIIPKAKITYLEGNHEDRFWKAVKIKYPDAYEKKEMELSRYLECTRLGITYYKSNERKSIRRGDCIISHGNYFLYKNAGHSDEDMERIFAEDRDYHSIDAAKFFKESVQGPRRTLLYGHTHKPQTMTTYINSNPLKVIGMGGLEDTKDYRKPVFHQIAVTYTREDQRTDVILLDITDGKMTGPDGTTYSVD